MKINWRKVLSETNRNFDVDIPWWHINLIRATVNRQIQEQLKLKTPFSVKALRLAKVLDDNKKLERQLRGKKK